MHTQLEDRLLWHDGSITVDPSVIEQFITYNNVYVTYLTDEISQYNRLVAKSKKVTTKQSNDPINNNYTIPVEFAELDMSKFINEKHQLLAKMFNWSEQEMQYRQHRVDLELRLYAEYNMENILRTLTYIINRLEQQQVVWGPGRGSSVSSYLLFIIGVHDVDSVFYELDITDFFK